MDAAACRPPCDGLLTVTIIRATNLLAADSNGLSDPFVQLQVCYRVGWRACLRSHLKYANRADPPVSQVGTKDKEQKSRVISNTCDPVYGDEFHFELSKDGPPQEYRLGLSVVDHDKLSANDTLGSLSLTLGRLFGDDWLSAPVRRVWALSDKEGKVDKYTVATRKLLNGEIVEPHARAQRQSALYGEIELELRFVDIEACRPPVDGLLTVALIRGRNLLPADSNGLSDPFVQLQLGTTAKPQKSRVISNTLDPVWGGDRFDWELSADGRPQDYRLELTVLDHDKLSANDTLGTLDLSLSNVFAGDKWLGQPPVHAVFKLSDKQGKVDKGAVDKRGGAFGDAVYGELELELSFTDAASCRPPCDGQVTMTEPRPLPHCVGGGNHAHGTLRSRSGLTSAARPGFSFTVPPGP